MGKLMKLPITLVAPAPENQNDGKYLTSGRETLWGRENQMKQSRAEWL